MLNLYQLERLIETQMKENHVPGLALTLLHNQEVVYARGFGVTSVEDGGLAVTPQTLFRIGSTTKPLTGTMIMRLVEAGKLDLDEPIKTYIDGFTLEDAQATNTITLRMLLSHTAGFPPAASPFGRRDPEGLEAFVREDLAHAHLVSPPGMVLNYSNPGIALAGYVAEVVGGKRYTELMQELVFEPLQMKHTTFDPTVAMTYPLAQAHDLSKDKVLSVQHRFADNTAHYPAGFALSNVLDLANFAIMQLNQGRFQGKHILSPESVHLMHTVQADLLTVKGTGYGLTFFTEQYKGARLVWHDGGISTFFCKFVLVPEADVAVILFCNRMGLNDETITRTILDPILGLPENEPEPLATSPERPFWPHYVGNYIGRWVGLAIIQVIDEQLALDLNGERIFLHAMKKNLYFGRKMGSEAIVSVGFVPGEEGLTSYIYLNTFVMSRCEVPISAHVDSSGWPNYGGTYALAGEDSFRVHMRESHLYITCEELSEEMVCTPISSTRFTTKMGIFDFHRDGKDGATILEYGELQKFPRVTE